MSRSRRINYKKIAPSDSFVGRYLQAMEALETPYAYDFWCALWCLSVALGRSVIVPRPRAPVFLNSYIILVAESGVTRKSTAVKRARRLVREAFAPGDESDVGSDSWRGRELEIIESKVTPEELEFRMHRLSQEFGRSEVAISVDELVRFLGKERYNLTMPGLLTDLYDSPELRSGGGTIARGRVVIRDVYLNFCSASTPSWLFQAINPDVIAGGFTSRCLFIFSEARKKRVAWPEPEKDTRKVTGALVGELQRIRATTADVNEIGISPGARKLFSDWYQRKAENIDPFRASFESREDDHVLRIAALLAVNDGAWLIRSSNVRYAIQLVKQVKDDASNLFAGTGADDKTLYAIEKLRTLFLSTDPGKPLTRTEVYQEVRSYVNRHSLGAILKVMHELQFIQAFELEKEGPGRKRTIYRATIALQDRGSIRTIMEHMEQ